MLQYLGAYRAHATYCGHETAEELALEGLPLASFRQRALSHIVDVAVLALIAVAMAAGAALWEHFVRGKADINLKFGNETEAEGEHYIIILVVYHGLFNYFANGRTPGKWVAGTRVVSLTGARLGRWQSIDRAGAGLWRGDAGIWAGLCADFLERQPHVRARPAGRDHRDRSAGGQTPGLMG